MTIARSLHLYIIKEAREWGGGGKQVRANPRKSIEKLYLKSIYLTHTYTRFVVIERKGRRRRTNSVHSPSTNTNLATKPTTLMISNIQYVHEFLSVGGLRSSLIPLLTLSDTGGEGVRRGGFDCIECMRSYTCIVL